jgi:hypothetical protein
VAITLDGTTGLSGPVILPAGTTTIPPLDFTSGTSLTTALAGAMEYDGNTLMFTPKGTERGLVPGMQFYCLNTAYAGANSTATQSIFGLTNGVTLSSSTMYEFEMSVTLLKTAGTTSHTFRTLFGGTATLNHILYDARVNCTPNVIGTYGGSSNQQGVTANVATVITTTGALTSANTYWSGLVKGVVSINSGGTFHPQYSLSVAPGGAYTTQVGSYFAIWPIGAAGSNVNIGTWS